MKVLGLKNHNTKMTSFTISTRVPPFVIWGLVLDNIKVKHLRIESSHHYFLSDLQIIIGLLKDLDELDLSGFPYPLDRLVDMLKINPVAVLDLRGSVLEQDLSLIKEIEQGNTRVGKCLLSTREIIPLARRKSSPEIYRFTIGRVSPPVTRSEFTTRRFHVIL